MCPDSEYLEVAEARAGDSFDIDFARNIVADLMTQNNGEEVLVEAYKVMANDADVIKPGLISKDLLYRKMLRRLGDEKVTEKMIQDGRPDSDGRLKNRTKMQFFFWLYIFLLLKSLLHF